MKVKKIKLLNSAVMGRAGSYCQKKISKEMFGQILKEAEEIESYIGYQSNIDYLKREFGIEVPMNRNLTEYEDGDLFLVMKLKYRVADPKEKGKWKPADDDYEFFIFSYKEDCELNIDDFRR